MKSEGYSSEEASSKAEQVIAKPGTSEHETGLAIDIAGDDDYDQDTDSVLEWMNSNAQPVWVYPALPIRQGICNGR